MSAEQPDPLTTLAQQVASAKAAAEAEADTPVTIADAAAAAFVALETLVAILGSEKGAQVIEQFEQRAAAFAASMEVGE